MDFLSIFFKVAQEYQVSFHLLYAIAIAESGLNPYAVNIEGKSYFPENRYSALRLIKSADSYDIGLMQINSYWIKKYSLKPEWLLVPEYNIRLGAGILKYCMNLFGNTWKAVDCYHRGEKRAKDFSIYTTRVCSILYNMDVCRY